jgi:poly(hydroxyalkanoate) depolymerase family esterase
MKPDAILKTIKQAMAQAGLDLQGGAMSGVVATIEQAIAKAGVSAWAPSPTSPRSPVPSAPTSKPRPAGRAARPPSARPDVPMPEQGQFVEHHHAGPAGSRDYYLYVPACAARAAMPLVMMLHGCQQNPVDFAQGTRMNALAEQHGFLVVYPAQSRKANGSNCWNWFQRADQQRVGGEPAILAAIVAEVSRSHAVDADRVYVAGLSAGASMAVILGATYPDIFTAVGAHSGLPSGAADDVASAFAAMAGAGAPAAAVSPAGYSVPTIVFHGDQDRTVVPANAQAIVEQVMAHPGAAAVTLQTVERGETAQRAFTTTVYAVAQGRPHVEHWVVHGSAHAWSGGSDEGSYTDVQGPDASAEMVRFFLAQRRKS